jgi:hypothetical protein
VNVDEDCRAGRGYMGKERVKREEKGFILEETIINLEAQNAIFTIIQYITCNHE